MTTKRPALLMGILLILVLGYVSRPYWPYWEWRLSGASAPRVEPPLAGTNAVSGLQVQRDANDNWVASFDCFYTGEPLGGVLQIELFVNTGAASAPAAAAMMVSGFKPALRGSHRYSVEIQRPPMAGAAITTTQVSAQLRAGGKVVTSQQIAQAIDWPDWETWSAERRLAGKSRDEIFNEAVELIDQSNRDSLREAKRLLERLIGKDARFDAGYVELARVAMKSNWGPEGLHQAETLLASALQIRPDSVNAKILLGYVFAHQGRYKPAEALFVEASGTDTKNLWLWANWGELLAMQGKFQPAEQKYREAVTRPRTHDTYDRARLDAYQHLLFLLDRRKNIDGMEALQKQRADEFGPGSCYSADYARFMLQQRGDAAAAIALARQAVEGRCGDPAAREVLGLAHYVAWAGAAGPQRDESLHQARVFLPAGPQVLYQLATSERTVAALQQLKASGEAIDQRDNRKFNALAYALERRDLEAARRLLRLGARPDALVGEADMPVALLPVISADLEAVRLMRQFRVDYANLRFQGSTAIDHAKRMGDRRLLEALGRENGSL